MGGIFGKKKTWDDLPVAMDGWMVSHDSLRYLMTLIRNTFDKLIADAEAGNLTKENVTRFATFFEHFYKEVHNHHDHEEKIFFPWMETKVKLPPKMSADHKTLIANLDDVKRHIEKLEGASAGAEELEILKAGQASFVNMQEHMCEHLQEEEHEGIPMVRENFTFQEHEAVVSDILKSMEWYELPQLIYQMDDQSRMRFMKTAGIPSLIIALVIKKQIRRFQREIMDPFVVIGQEVPPRAAASA